MIGLHGEKMSKSKGNLVFVSRLRADHVDSMAVRLALLADHYRTDRQWTDDLLKTAAAAAGALARGRRGAGGSVRCRTARRGPGGTVRRPRHSGRARTRRRVGRRGTRRRRVRRDAPALMATTVDALLGIAL